MSPEDKDLLILRILKGIEAAKPKPSHDGWNACWDDNSSPPYYGSTIIRENGELKEVDGDYEYRKFKTIRNQLFEQYCQMPIYEFGCGTGHNIEGLEAKGFDWSETAIDRLRAKHIEAEVFDMYHPRDMQIPGAVVTIHAMEQLGRNFQPFLEFLIRAKPKVIVHIEPLIELYEDNLLDYLAVQYHRKRGYLEGYVEAVRNRGTILRLERSYFGSLYHEAYSILVWKP